MTPITDLIAPLGPPVERSEPVRLTKRNAEVVVTEHAEGWSIIGTSVLRPGRPFVAIVKRCLLSNQCDRSPRDCIGHQPQVLRLAEKVKGTYR